VTNLPEPARRRLPAVHPSLLRGAVSPTAVAVTAAGAGIGALDHSLVLGITLAAVGWAGRMGAAVVARARRVRAQRPKPARLDPWSVPEPWRSLVEAAMATQARFDQTVKAWPAGPTRDHLVDLQPRVWHEVGQLGLLAGRGAAADGGAGSSDLVEQMQRVQQEKAVAGRSARAAELGRREEALAAQLRARRSREKASEATQDRLRAAIARLDEAIANLLGLEPDGFAPTAVVSSLDELSEGLNSLRAALTETTGTPTEPGRP